MKFTIFELYDWLACYQSHDLREVDMQWVVRYKKVEVDESTAKKIQEAKKEEFEAILKLFI